MTSFYTTKELHSLGLKCVGDNVLLSRKCSLYSPEKISIGNNVRIDDFCILSGNITIGSHVHISAYCALYGSMGIELEDFCGISPRGMIFSATDDFGGDYLVGPVHPKYLTHVTGGTVYLKKYSQIGTDCVVFPNITIGEGAVTGAMTLVNKDLEPWTVNTGIPVNRSRPRKCGLLEKVKTLQNMNGGGGHWYSVF